jgi:tRNA threonylcarbamoyladenosine biosynthesis protein TsaB
VSARINTNMRILAIETTDLSGSIAALDSGRIVAAVDLNPLTRSAQSLAPAIVELLQTASWQPADVELAAVTTGPGSFTGLRVGVTTAKLFAYTVGAAVIGVNTLDVIAAQSPSDVAYVWSVLDAQRGQVFASQYLRDSSGHWQPQTETLLLDNAQWLALLSAGQAVTGPALIKLSGQVPSGVKILDRSLWSPKATTVGQLAWQHYQSGRRADLFSLLPQYFRLSAAEEKRTADSLSQSASSAKK